MAKLPFFAPDGLYLKDDFLSNDGVADATVGDLNWEMVTIGGASTPSFIQPGAPGAYGVMCDTTDSTTAHGEVYRLNANSIVLGSKGGFFRAKVQLHDTLTGNNLRFGLQDSETATDSTCGIWVDILAGVVTVQADSATEGDHTLTVTGCPTLTGGTTCVVATWHEFEVRWEGENAAGGPARVHTWIDGWYAGPLECELDDDEPMELSITHWDTGAGATLEAYIDYIELFIAR